MNNADFQELIYGLIGFIELRFGVYLDTVLGFDNNLDVFVKGQVKSITMLNLSVEELDKTFLIRGNGPPSSDLDECKKREIHRMTQGEFKKNNSRGGVNYNFAIENCLSDIFNYWDGVKGELGFKKKNEEKDDQVIFPIMGYMRSLRNRVQHDLYPERVVGEKNEIKLVKTLTNYTFPKFRIGETIVLSEVKIEALVFEIRVQLKEIFVPYISSILDLEESLSL